MRFRGHLKKIAYGYRRRFRYYGHTVYFPYGSHIFDLACEQGIYERELTDLILSIMKPGSAYFDIGANIGLLSIPVVALMPGVEVISVEASPDTLPALRKTHSAARSRNWTIVGAAVGRHAGETEFWTGGGSTGAYDGVRNTGRGGPKRAIRVPMQTIDDIWEQCGRPQVGLIKLDIEGSEALALQGATETILSAKPVIVLEWNEPNLAAYSVNPGELLLICTALGYGIFAFPNLVHVNTELLLRMAMRQTETFVLTPDPKRL